jgi:hypothetical protein
VKNAIRFQFSIFYIAPCGFELSTQNRTCSRLIDLFGTADRLSDRIEAGVAWSDWVAGFGLIPIVIRVHPHMADLRMDAILFSARAAPGGRPFASRMI